MLLLDTSFYIHVFLQATYMYHQLPEEITSQRGIYSEVQTLNTAPGNFKDAVPPPWEMGFQLNSQSSLMMDTPGPNELKQVKSWVVWDAVSDIKPAGADATPGRVKSYGEKEFIRGPEAGSTGQSACCRGSKFEEGCVDSFTCPKKHGGCPTKQ